MKDLGAQDHITGFWNRRALFEHLELRLAHDPTDSSIGVLSIRLDRLSTVNRVFGHFAGDQLVNQFSEQLRNHVHRDTFTAKLDDNQIIVVLSKPSRHSEAAIFARQLHAAIDRQFTVGAEEIACSISIGVAVGLPRQHSASDLVRNVEHALFAAKEAGGNAVAAFNDDLAATFELRADLDLHLPDAIDNGDISLHYQPEVDLRTGSVVAIESIVQWDHPTRGILSPRQLFPAAESTGHAAALARRILWLSCQRLQRWRENNLASNVVMRIQLPLLPASTPSLITDVTQTLQHFELPPHALSLAFQESVDFHQSPVSGALNWLKTFGLGLTLENFGTKYSGFGAIKTLPVDTIKIDPSFVQRLTEDTGNAAIIRTLAALSDQLGLELVANGLQHQADAEALLELGCRRAQGPLLSPPLDADAATEMLKAPLIARTGHPQIRPARCQ